MEKAFKSPISLVCMCVPTLTHSLMQTAAHRHRTFLGNYAVTDKGMPDWIVSPVHDESLTPGEEVVE